MHSIESAGSASRTRGATSLAAGSVREDEAVPALLHRATDARVDTVLRSPVAAAVLFVATVIPVCSDPLVTLITGRGEWTLQLPPVVFMALVILACLVQALAVSRLATRPELAVLASLGCYLAAAVALNVPTWATPMHLVVAVAMFALGSARPAALVAIWAVGTVTAAIAVLVVWAHLQGVPTVLIASFVLTEGGGLATIAWAAAGLGVLWAAHARRTRRADARASQIERAQQAAIDASRDNERGRIAQELHDVAGQHLAGLVSLCDASIELAPAHPARALELIEEVRAEGRYAAASLYGALGDLRAVDTGAHSPTPDLRRLEELVGFWQERGAEVSLAFTGSPSTPPTVVSAIAYQAVREALSNAAKHAPGAPVRVSVAVRAEEVEVRVVNGPARRDRDDEAELGLGWGLQSLADKLALVDGRLQTSGDGAGGWELRVTIPFAAQTGEPG